MTIRPCLRSQAIGLVLDQDSLDRARRSGAMDALTLVRRGARRVEQPFFAVYLEYLRGEEGALGVPLAAVEVDDDLHPGALPNSTAPPLRLRCQRARGGDGSGEERRRMGGKYSRVLEAHIGHEALASTQLWRSMVDLNHPAAVVA